MKKVFRYKLFAILGFLFVAVVIATILTTGTMGVTYAYYSENDGEIYYKGIGTGRPTTETFSYATKSTESYMINSSYPNYYNMNTSLTNFCGPVAGANLIGFFDRYSTNLIPGVSPGRGYPSGYRYTAMMTNSEEKQAVIDDLYGRMQTNVYNDGTTQEQYKNGLTSYVQSKGYSITYSSVMTNGSFDLEKAKSQLQAGNPISLFMAGFNISNISDNGSTVTLNKVLYDSHHISIVFGFDKVVYYNSNGSVLREEIYLKVATGYSNVSGDYIVFEYGQLSDAEAAHIA